MVKESHPLLRALRGEHIRDGKLSCEESFEKSNAANTQSDSRSSQDQNQEGVGLNTTTTLPRTVLYPNSTLVWCIDRFPISQAINLPDAQAALDWNGVHQKRCQIGTSQRVKSKSEVIQQAKKESRQTQFASLMDLCHLKHAERPKHLRKYKSKVVFRRDIVKDDEGYQLYSQSKEHRLLRWC